MKKIIALFLFLSAGSVLFAQATKASQDAGLWATLNVEKKLSDRFNVLFTEECRLRDNYSRVNLFYTDIGLETNVAKFLKVALCYRNIQKSTDPGFYSFRHRFMLDITLKKKFGNFVLSYRQRIQREARNIYTSERGYLPEWYSRNKFGVKYDFGKRITPYVSAEFRYQLHDPRMMESDQTWHRARYVAGIDYELGKKSSLGLYYLMQHEWNVKTPQTIFITGVEYNFKF
ncbi:MAG: DUF2490 domain-containing protein [Bacteroidia bacterium]